MADTRHRPQSCRCCLPTQAAGWGTVIRLERGVGGNAQTSVCVCVFVCWCHSHAHGWCHDWLAVTGTLSCAADTDASMVCDTIHYSWPLPLSFISFCLSFDAYGYIWVIALHLFFSISKHKLRRDHLIHDQGQLESADLFFHTLCVFFIYIDKKVYYSHLLLYTKGIILK